METEFRWSGRDAREDPAVDASSAIRLDIGQETALRRAKRAWTSSLESASSVVNLVIWPVSAGTELTQATLSLTFGREDENYEAKKHLLMSISSFYNDY